MSGKSELYSVVVRPAGRLANGAQLATDDGGNVFEFVTCDGTRDDPYFVCTACGREALEGWMPASVIDTELAGEFYCADHIVMEDYSTKHQWCVMSGMSGGYLPDHTFVMEGSYGDALKATKEEAVALFESLVEGGNRPSMTLSMHHTYDPALMHEASALYVFNWTDKSRLAVYVRLTEIDTDLYTELSAYGEA